MGTPSARDSELGCMWREPYLPAQAVGSYRSTWPEAEAGRASVHTTPGWGRAARLRQPRRAAFSFSVLGVWRKGAVVWSRPPGVGSSRWHREPDPGPWRDPPR